MYLRRVEDMSREELEEEVQLLRSQLGMDEDFEQLTFFCKRFDLSPLEARLLQLLYKAHGKPRRHERLLAGMYPGEESPDANVISVYVWRLRKHLRIKNADAKVDNIYGQGYFLNEVALRLVHRSWISHQVAMRKISDQLLHGRRPEKFPISHYQQGERSLPVGTRDAGGGGEHHAPLGADGNQAAGDGDLPFIRAAIDALQSARNGT